MQASSFYKKENIKDHYKFDKVLGEYEFFWFDFYLKIGS